MSVMSEAAGAGLLSLRPQTPRQPFSGKKKTLRPHNFFLPSLAPCTGDTTAMKSLTLSTAIDGFLLDLAARRLSPHTIADYTNSLRKLQAFLPGDPELASITADELRQFMADLETPRRPAGVTQRPLRGLSKKQCLNIHTGLSAFYTWALRNRYIATHQMRLIIRPKPEKRQIVPLTKAEIEALLWACERSKSYRRPGKRECDHTRPTGIRDRAILLLLLDTGLRASELCGLRIADYDAKNRRVLAFGKGDKERSLPISPTTAKALWEYMSAERKEARLDELLFLGVGRGAADALGAGPSAEESGRAGGGGGCASASVPPYVCDQLSAERGGCVCVADLAGTREPGDGADVSGAGQRGPGDGASAGESGGAVAVMMR